MPTQDAVKSAAEAVTVIAPVSAEGVRVTPLTYDQ
jgi:hypothetical protein